MIPAQRHTADRDSEYIIIAKWQQKWPSGSTTNEDVFSARVLFLYPKQQQNIFADNEGYTNQQNYAWRDTISRFIHYYPSDTSQLMKPLIHKV
jgi:hypothetical protein